MPDLLSSSPGYSVLACFNPPCFSMCCSAAPTNISSVAFSETSPTHATNRTGKYQQEVLGQLYAVRPTTVSPQIPHLVSHLPLHLMKMTRSLCKVPSFLHTDCLEGLRPAPACSQGAKQDCQAAQPLLPVRCRFVHP